MTTQIRTTRLLHLDGREWASAGFMGPGDAWGWIVESVAAECECAEDDVHCVEDPEGGGDLVTVDGLPCYRIAHGHAGSSGGSGRNSQN